MWNSFLQKIIFLDFTTRTRLGLDGRPVYLPGKTDSAPSSNCFIHDPMTLILIIFYFSYLFCRLHPSRARSEKKSERDCNLRQGLTRLWPWSKTNPPSGFAHKVSLSFAHSFTHCPWLLLDYGGRAEERRQRSLGLQSLTYLLAGLLQINFHDSGFRFFVLIDKNVKDYYWGLVQQLYSFLNRWWCILHNGGIQQTSGKLKSIIQFLITTPQGVSYMLQRGGHELVPRRRHIRDNYTLGVCPKDPREHGSSEMGHTTKGAWFGVGTEVLQEPPLGGEPGKT